MKKTLSILSICFLLSASIPVHGVEAKKDEETDLGKEEETLQPGLKKSRIFGVLGLTSTVGAVVSDALVEWNYDAYRKVKVSEDCLKYRDRTILMERVRDGCLYAALASFATAIIFSRLEQSSVSADVRITPGRLPEGRGFEVLLVKSF